MNKQRIPENWVRDRDGDFIPPHSPGGEIILSPETKWSGAVGYGHLPGMYTALSNYSDGPICQEATFELCYIKAAMLNWGAP